MITTLIYYNNQKLTEHLQRSNDIQTTPRVEILPPVEDTRVIISNTGTKLSVTGTVKVMGEVYNIAGYELSQVEIIAALYDESGHVVDRGTDTVFDLAEESKYIFEIIIRNAAPFLRYEVVSVVTE